MKNTPLASARLMNLFAWVSILSAAVLLGYFIFMMVFPFNPLEVEEPLFVHEKIIPAGDMLNYDVTFCKHTDKPSTIQRYLSNSLDRQLDSMLVHRDPSCQTADLQIMIPENTPPGEYTIRHVAIYDYGLFRDVTVRYETEKFIVR